MVKSPVSKTVFSALTTSSGEWSTRNAASAHASCPSSNSSGSILATCFQCLDASSESPSAIDSRP